jgi:hypothetical protein
MMKILFYIDGVSNSVDNDVQRDVMNKLAASVSNDKDIEIIDTSKIAKDKAHQILINQNYDVLFTYNRTATEIKYINNTKEEYILKKIDKMHVCWLTEHPVTFYANYLNSENNRHYIFPNDAHSFFSESMGLKGSYSKSLFGSEPTKFIKAHADRTYEMCIAAQWRGPEEANAFWKNTEGKVRNFFESVLELQDSDENRDIYVAYLAAAQYYKIDMTDKLWHANAMKSIYWYARKKERINLVKDAAATGMKMILIGGDAWKTVLPPKNKITIKPECTHEELRALYGESKSVVNLNASNGACERAFDCLSAGSMLISEESKEMVNLFEVHNAARLFKPNHAHEKFNEFREIIQSGDSQEIANNGTRKFLENHTWKHRGNYLSIIFDELMETTTFN